MNNLQYMKNAKLLADTMCQEYLSSSVAKKYTKISTLVKDNLNDSIFLSRRADTLNVEANHFGNAIFGIHRLQIALMNGYLDENLVRKFPRFSLRPLWLECNHSILFDKNISIAIPDFLANSLHDSQSLHHLCRRLLEWGYNAIVFGERAITPVISKSEGGKTFQFLCQTLQDYGIKVIVKCPTHCLEAFPTELIDILFYEAALENISKDLTQLDVAIREINHLEQNKKPLIYFIPSHDIPTSKRHAHWIPRLCDEVGSQTILAFSPFVGNPWDESAAPHPLWEVLRQSLDTSSTPLMPLVNAGCLNFGEGLWPILPIDLMELCFDRMHRHPFAGALVLANKIPERKTLADCNLWIASQMQWDFTSANLCAETWFKTHFPDFNYSIFSRSFAQFRQIAIELKTLSKSSDAWRIQSESLLSRLNYEKNVFGQVREFSSYFHHFEQDIRRILLDPFRNC